MDYRRLFDIPQHQAHSYPQKIALAWKQENKWTTFSTQEVIDLTLQVSAGLMDLGLERGDKISIVSFTGNPYWNFLDLGAQQAGIIVVPIYPTSSPDEYEYILKESEVKAVFAFTKNLYEKVNSINANLPDLKHIFCFEKVEGVPRWKDLIKTPDENHLAELDALRAAIHEDDLATIIYTSGTTGNPKGVMLSHKNIVSNIKSTIALLPIDCEKTALSFLPLSHIFERMVIFSYIAVGASVYYAESYEKVLFNFKEVRPHYFTSVPRLLEKIYDGIISRGLGQGKLKKNVFLWALKLGEKFDLRSKPSFGYRLKLSIANFLVFSRWRKALGGRVEGVVVGAASMQARIARLFSAAGIPIREGYGLTETAPVLTFNRFEPGLVMFGTVGIPVPGVEIKIAEDGEILAKGPNIMMGYYKKEALTKAVINEEGWFHTGDVGEFTHKYFLKITDRKKELFKTSGGKYVAPQKVENHFLESPFIEQIMVLGNQRPYTTALVIPNFTTLKLWSAENNIHWTGPQYMVLDPKIIEKLNTVREELNQSLSKTEQVKKFTLLFEEWSNETGELTPTLKLKRKAILNKYEKNINLMYE